MHLQLVIDPTPEWIIGEDAASGDAWLVHTRLPRFTARVCHCSVVTDGRPSIRLSCGLTLADLRWLSPPSRQTGPDELFVRADRVLGDWLQRHITRASRAA